MRRAVPFAASFVVVVACEGSKTTNTPDPVVGNPPVPTPTASESAAPSVTAAPTTTASAAPSTSTSTAKNLPKVPADVPGKVHKLADGRCMFHREHSLKGFQCPPPPASCMPPNPPPPYEVECP